MLMVECASVAASTHPATAREVPCQRMKTTNVQPANQRVRVDRRVRSLSQTSPSCMRCVPFPSAGKILADAERSFLYDCRADWLFIDACCVSVMVAPRPGRISFFGCRVEWVE